MGLRTPYIMNEAPHTSFISRYSFLPRRLWNHVMVAAAEWVETRQENDSLRGAKTAIDWDSIGVHAKSWQGKTLLICFSPSSTSIPKAPSEMVDSDTD
jgi:hypothetical protein